MKSYRVAAVVKRQPPGRSLERQIVFRCVSESATLRNFDRQGYSPKLGHLLQWALEDSDDHRLRVRIHDLSFIEENLARLLFAR